MPSPREYPERPIVGVGGVLIENGKALLIRRGSEPLLGQWSIPGGTLELGETLLEGVARQMLEETAVTVRVLDLIEVFERISPYSTPEVRDAAQRPQFHFVIVDYLCEKVSGEAKAGGDATDVAFASEDDLPHYQLTDAATRVLRSAFAMERARRKIVGSEI